jgi:hypothetical protein
MAHNGFGSYGVMMMALAILLLGVAVLVVTWRRERREPRRRQQCVRRQREQRGQRGQREHGESLEERLVEPLEQRGA